MPVRTKSEPSLFRSSFETLMGLTNATNPKIIPKLKIFDPSTLPTEIESWLPKAAEIETANSGAEVAIATIVNPITKSDKPNFLAIFEAESTIHDAPPHNPIMESAKIKMLNRINHPLTFIVRVKDKVKKGFYKI